MDSQQLPPTEQAEELMKHPHRMDDQSAVIRCESRQQALALTAILYEENPDDEFDVEHIPETDNSTSAVASHQLVVKRLHYADDIPGWFSADLPETPTIDLTGGTEDSAEVDSSGIQHALASASDDESENPHPPVEFHVVSTTKAQTWAVPVEYDGEERSAVDAEEVVEDAHRDGASNKTFYEGTLSEMLNNADRDGLELIRN